MSYVAPGVARLAQKGRVPVVRGKVRSALGLLKGFMPQQLPHSEEVYPIHHRVVLQICTFTEKYAMVPLPLERGFNGPHPCAVFLLSERAGDQRRQDRHR